MENHLKMLARYEREARLSYAVIRELKKHGFSAVYVGKQLSIEKARTHPVSIVINRKILALVRVGGTLTNADRAWLRGNPFAIVLGAPGSVLAALPGIQGLSATAPASPLAAALLASSRKF